MASLSVLEVLDSYSKIIKPKIKWVNDVFMNDLKISGSLAKAEY